MLSTVGLGLCQELSLSFAAYDFPPTAAPMLAGHWVNLLRLSGKLKANKKKKVIASSSASAVIILGLSSSLVLFLGRFALTF